MPINLDSAILNCSMDTINNILIAIGLIYSGEINFVKIDDQISVHLSEDKNSILIEIKVGNVSRS